MQQTKIVLTRDQIDEFAEFDNYLKNLPNIELKKQPSRKGIFDIDPNNLDEGLLKQGNGNFPTIKK